MPEKAEDAGQGNEQTMPQATAKAPKAKKNKPKAAALPLAQEHPTRHSELSNNGEPPSRF